MVKTMNPISSQTQPTDAEPALVVSNLCKSFTLYAKPIDRLWQALGKHSANTRHFHALTDISFSLAKGEVVGVVGRNGAGKSTLLQLICGTLNPSSGSIKVNGRIAALLELGSGFNPEFTGRDNVFMNAAVLGLSRAEIEAKYDDIVDFAELSAFMDQPVKTYSSGMLVRLAFAVATSVEPDILIIDEALSVGDGVFARKSFDRIMQLRDAGTSILFCSHSLYQVEALCNKAIWLKNGLIAAMGESSLVISQYQTFLNSVSGEQKLDNQRHVIAQENVARITNVEVSMDNVVGKKLQGVSGKSCLKVTIHFISDIDKPCPSCAVTISTLDHQIIASAGTANDKVELVRSSTGAGLATLVFNPLLLLKGSFVVGAYLFCEKGLHNYEWIDPVAEFTLSQADLEQGIVRLPHTWKQKCD